MDVYGTFWLYSAICSIGLLYGIFFLPETKGRRLEEISTQFNAKDPTQFISFESKKRLKVSENAN